jgi:YfiH family protein
VYGTLNLGLHVSDDPARVGSNRSALARAAGVDADRLVFAEQVHGAGVAVVDGPAAQPLAGVDGLVTAVPGLALVVLAADCLPVLLSDQSAGVVAAVHAGRAGLVAGVLQRALEVMASLGAAAAGTVAVIGPAACGRCYEVPEAMAAEVERAVPSSRARTFRGSASVDLTAGATGILRRSGVAHVTAVGGCTIEQPERFFSYRRDGLTGRHGAVIRRA